MYPTSMGYAEVVNHLCLKDKSCLQILWFLAGAGHFPKQLCSATIREYEFLQPPRNLHVQGADCQEPGIMMVAGMPQQRSRLWDPAGWTLEQIIFIRQSRSNACGGERLCERITQHRDLDRD